MVAIFLVLFSVRKLQIKKIATSGMVITLSIMCVSCLIIIRYGHMDGHNGTTSLSCKIMKVN